MIAKGKGTSMMSGHPRRLYIGVTSELLEKRNPEWGDLALPDAM
jgi:hypothetical protein